MQKLIEHHEMESSRLRGNIDFWKEKVDGLIKAQKEMLENKTKLHLQVESSEQKLSQAVSEIKDLNEEIEVL